MDEILLNNTYSNQTIKIKYQIAQTDRSITSSGLIGYQLVIIGNNLEILLVRLDFSILIILRLSDSRNILAVKICELFRF